MANKEGEGIPIPSVIDPPESMAVTLCVPKNTEHLAAFFGALYQLTVWTSWQRNGTNEGKQVADVWWRYFLSWDQSINDIDCEDGMSDCCTEPAITRRVNPTTGLIEQSTNGGATWTPAAGGINSYIVEPVPPVTSGVAANRCDAATNLSGQVQVWIDQVTNDFDTATTLLEFATAVLTAILAAVLTILSAGTLTAVEALVLPTIAAALTAAWGAGKAVFVAYWTTEIKDKILCAALCNIGDDGSFTDAQFSGFWGDVNSDLPPSPAKMLFMGFLSSVGRQGVNAMAASGMSADADCNDCTECLTCPEKWHMRSDLADFARIDEVGEDYIICSAFAPLGGGGGYYIVVQTGNPDNCCLFVSYEIISGGSIGFAGIDCGQTSSPGFGIWTGHCINELLANSAAPFQIKLFLSDCP